MAGMTTEELELFFAEQFKKNMDKERATIVEECSKKGMGEAELKAAVDAHLKSKELDEDKRKALRAEMMEQFEIASITAGSKGLGEPKPHEIVSQMLVVGLKAMEEQKQLNIKNVPYDAILSVAKKIYPEGKLLHGLMQKTLTAGTPALGGFTIPQILIPDYIKFLYANTILDKLGVQKVPMPAGNFSLPRMDASSAVGWVGETESKDETNQGFGAVNLRAKKLKAMTAISNTLLRQNVVGLDSWVSMDLQTQARIALDKAFLYGLGTEFTPKGLKKITGIQTAGGTTTALAVDTPIDVMALLEEANVPMINPFWILSPIGKAWMSGKAFASGPFAWAEEMNKLKTLNSVPFVSSSSVEKASDLTYSDFWLLDAALVLWGVSYDLSIEMSREGTFTSGGQTVSAFDQDLTLIRVIGEHDFAVRQPKAVVYAQYKKTA